MKKIVFGMIAVAAVVVAFAANTPAASKTEGCCKTKEAKVVAQAAVKAEGCCKAKAKAAQVEAKAEGCCKSKEAKVVAQTAAEGCCKSKAAKVQAKAEGCESGACGDKAVQAKAVDGKEACCKSTAAKPIAKGSKGCCNETGAPAKFKVFADGKWMFYGCRGSAEKGRRELLTMAFRVGQVLPVTGNARIPRNQSLL